jgi:transcriptional regulator with XRE-family HTH domain
MTKRDTQKEADMNERGTGKQSNDLLRRERLLRGWSQQDIANHLGTDGYTVNRWERGRAMPSPYFRQKLCALFGKNAEALGLLREQGNAEAHSLAVPECLGQLAQGDEEIQLVPTRIALPAYWHVPSQRNPFFTGREEILHQLHEVLTPEKTAALNVSYALSGLGGIGKTQVAIEYAYRYAGEYHAVFWLAAETVESLMSSLQHIAEQLHLPERQATGQSQMVAAVAEYTPRLAAHRG